MTKMNPKKWLKNKYIFYEDIFEYDGGYYLNFCLKEDAQNLINLCIKYDIPFTYKPPYALTLRISHLKILIKKIKFNEKNINYNLQESSLQAFY